MGALSLLVLSLVVNLMNADADAPPASLDSQLKPALTQHGLPAVAAAVIQDGKIVAAGAVGTRRAGQDIPVTINDRFHLGSDTKAMTSLLVGMLVEEKKLRWDMTVAEALPELESEMDPRLKTVTLTQLLSHTSGIPSEDQQLIDLIRKGMQQDGNLDEMRYWLVKQLCRLPLAAAPGEKFAYSNMGYVLVGVILERKTGKTWDELITERVFEPLELSTSGLGCQASLGKVDAPLPHVVVQGKPVAVLAGPNGDNPLILGPAGIAHMSILDFARWAGWNAAEGKRGPKLVEPETLRKLHTPVFTVTMGEKRDAGTPPPKGKYALGWGEVTIDWAGKPLLFHGGSNGMNLAHVWVDPERDFAMVLTTNIGGEPTEEALREIAGKLYEEYGKKAD